MDTLPRRVLVTGLSGFVGGHIQEMSQWLLDEHNAKILTVDPKIDLRDKNAVYQLIGESRPDWVIHLAAQSNVPVAFKNPEETFQINVIGTLHLLQALDHAQFTGRFLFISSGDVYGITPEELLPVTERQLPKPVNPYAVSKLSAEALCLQWAIKSAFDVMVARSFNHIGPGQRPDFVIPSIAQQLAKDGHEAPVMVGDIDVTRDFLDVRDVINAYFSLLARGRSRIIYNVCSGVERRVRDLALLMAKMADKEIIFIQDPERFRPAEQKRVFGDNQRIREDTGWKPMFDISTTLLWILNSFK